MTATARRDVGTSDASVKGSKDMIDTQKFIKRVTAAFQSARTQSDLQASTKRDLESLKADVTHALVTANCDDKVSIRQLLLEAQAGLRGIDLDGIHVSRDEASAARVDLNSQIQTILVTL